MDFEPTCYRENMSHEAYRAVDALSYSTLKAFHECNAPSKFYDLHLSPSKPAHHSTPDMELGSAFHTLVLQPDLFATTYAKAPQIRRGTKEWKDVEASNAGKTLLKEADWSTIHDMADRVFSNRCTRKLLENGNAEESFFWQEPTTGRRFKCRSDFRSGSFVVDLKTCQDAATAPGSFPKTVKNYKYHWQSYLYSKLIAKVTGQPVEAFIFIAIEKTYPYLVIPQTLDKEWLKIAEAEVELEIAAYFQCKEENLWKIQEEKIYEIQLPKWGLL